MKTLLGFLACFVLLSFSIHNSQFLQLATTSEEEQDSSESEKDEKNEDDNDDNDDNGGNSNDEETENNDDSNNIASVDTNLPSEGSQRSLHRPSLEEATTAETREPLSADLGSVDAETSDPNLVVRKPPEDTVARSNDQRTFTEGQPSSAATTSGLETLDNLRLAVPVWAPSAKGSESIDLLPNSVRNSAEPGVPNNFAFTSSRQELIDKVSTEQELLSLLQKFRSFINKDLTSPLSNPLVNKITTQPAGSVVIHYEWDPPQVIRDKYAVLMLKFTDLSGKIISDRIDYILYINNGTESGFVKYGSTNTGVDLKIIDENTFPTDSLQDAAADYSAKIRIPRINGALINEYTPPMEVTVIT